MLWTTAFIPVEVRTHYRGTRGPRHSMTVIEQPLWRVSNSWQGLTEVESATRTKALVNFFMLPLAWRK